MSVHRVYRCDDCGVEGGEGHAGAPPDGWVDVTAQIAGHVRIDGDFCPECSAKLDVLSFALSGKPLAPIVTSKTPRAGRKPAKPEPEEETLDLDDHSE